MPSFRWCFAIVLLVAAVPAWADGMAAADKPATEAARRRFPQPVRVGALLGRQVLQPLESQPVLGRVDGLFRGSANETVVVISRGGFLGLGARRIAVPVEAMALLGEYMELLDLTPEQLDARPTFQDAGWTALAPETVIDVGLGHPPH